MPRPPATGQLGPEPSSRPPLRRIKVLHERLASGTFPNCRKLAEELEVSPKTIQRDIDFMRDQLRYPIVYDHARLGFFYDGPIPSLPGLEVSAGELLALYVAQKALGQFRGTAFEKQLTAAFRRLTETLQDKVSFTWGEVDDSISFHKVGTSEADLRVFEEVSRATIESREVQFQYRKLDQKVWETRALQPYHLGSIENQWYVIGRDLERKALRTFALTRMRRARVLEATFTKPEDFSIESHLRESFGVFAGGPNRYTVRIRFHGTAARLVAERQWHPTQTITEAGPETVELTLQLCSLREIERWVLSWGARAEVLEPPALIERLRKSVTEMARQYTAP